MTAPICEKGLETHRVSDGGFPHLKATQEGAYEDFPCLFAGRTKSCALALTMQRWQARRTAVAKLAGLSELAGAFALHAKAPADHTKLARAIELA